MSTENSTKNVPIPVLAEAMNVGCVICGKFPTYSGLCTPHVYDEQLPLGPSDQASYEFGREDSRR